jgi:hypothetical protein
MPAPRTVNRGRCRDMELWGSMCVSEYVLGAQGAILRAPLL